jgi:PKD repeat protein
MKFQSLSLYGLVFILALTSSYAQTIRCATMEQDSINRVRFPQRGQLNDFEDQIQLKIQEITARSKSGKTKAEIIKVPIVVHIVHNGEPVGSGTNISQAQVQAQIEVLNEDFRRKVGTPGFNNNSVGADIEIEFCLSPVDVNGATLTEPGIHRVKGNQASWSRNQIDGTLKPSTIWNPNLFFNIWTVKFGGPDSNLLGYAQFPDNSNLAGLNSIGGPGTTDGVVVQYSSFGSVDKGSFPVMQAPYNKGRTLTHEIGHFLGLRHIWGDGACGNDFVDDTPTQQNESRGCAANKIGCDGNTPAMVQNYMDYSDDACMNIFTKGQKTRIRAVMELSPRRKTFVQSTCNGAPNSAPIADFTTDNQQCILLGSNVTFTDLSSSFPTSWKWTFAGGDPATSTIQNPTVKYNTSGEFDVTLEATNSIGQSSVTKTKYVVVTNQGICNSFTNYLPGYTPSVIKLSSLGNYKGYLTGHNSLRSKAFSELFSNACKYQYISGVNIKFGKLYTTREDATVTVVVWNARNIQNGPGAVIERKQVLLKQIRDDIANNRPTAVLFSRETPVFGAPFHVGFEIDYANSDTVVVNSSADDEATNATSWVQSFSGEWATYSIAFGANIALDIQPQVGINPSVQVGSSKTLIYPGEEVTLNGRGASIFVWNATDGSVSNVIGPQLIVRPDKTTTYITSGSGLELCNKTASTTIYIREGEVTEIGETLDNGLQLHPNPGTSTLTVLLKNNARGIVSVQLKTILSQPIGQYDFLKDKNELSAIIDTSLLLPGVYITTVIIGEEKYHLRWIKK